MKKLFVFSDVHSFYEQLQAGLQAAAFDVNDADHILVSCGDLCDRGDGSVEVLDFLNGIPAERKICIAGNHEVLMEDAIRRGYLESYDLHNMTDKTIQQLTGMPGQDPLALYKMKKDRRWTEYRKHWRWYFETKHYIFLHGWLPCQMEIGWYAITAEKYDPNWRKASYQEWENAVWINGMDAWNRGIREQGKTVVCGHVHSSWGNAYLHQDGQEYPEDGRDTYVNYDPFIDEGIVSLDSCTMLSGRVNVQVIELSDAEWQEALENNSSFR